MSIKFIHIGIIIIGVLSMFLFAGCSNSATSPTETARSFLESFLNGNENQTRAYSSISLISAAEELCFDGQITNCIDHLGRDEWGQLETLVFDYGRPRTHVYGFTVSLVNARGLFVVIRISQGGDNWVVDGWRGFTTETDGLIDGDNQVNAFPPLD